MYVQEFSHDIV